MGPLKENKEEEKPEPVDSENGSTEQEKAGNGEGTAKAVSIGESKAVRKKRSEYMKWHKLFAWGTVVCFVMTMVTGYKRK